MKNHHHLIRNPLIKKFQVGLFSYSVTSAKTQFIPSLCSPSSCADACPQVYILVPRWLQYLSLTTDNARRGQLLQ
jgi:hypothetical protein